MANRGWGGSVALAVGVAAGTAAAQLGLAYGLGVMAWAASSDQGGQSTRLASLAWTSWIAATSTILGAVIADRMSAGEIGAAPTRRSTVDGLSRRVVAGSLATGLWRVVLALGATVGALLTVPLVAIPARAAHWADTYSPQQIAGGYAIVGVLIGLIIAMIALSSRAIAANVLATAAWLWALAVGSVIDGATTGRAVSTAQLAVWRFGSGHFLRSTFSIPGAALMMGSALIIGALAAWPADRRGDNRIGVAISGAFGPLLVAAAYFLATPKLVGVQTDEQLSAFLIAPYAVIAGLTGSVALSSWRAHRAQRAQERAAAEAPGSDPVIAPATGGLGSGGAGSGRAGDALAEDSYAPAEAYQSTGAAALASAPAGPAPLWPDQEPTSQGGTGAGSGKPATKRQRRR